MGASASANKHPFFVYGTLLPGQPNAHLWTPYATTTRPAVLPGAQLHDMGYYPMLIEVDGASAVHGVLLTIPAAHLSYVTQLLDRLERYDPPPANEGLYRRSARPVQLTDDATVDAWVYIGRRAVATPRPLVPNGDWATYTHRQQQEMARWWRDHGADYDRSLGADGKL